MSGTPAVPNIFCPEQAEYLQILRHSSSGAKRKSSCTCSTPVLLPKIQTTEPPCCFWSSAAQAQCCNAGGVANTLAAPLIRAWRAVRQHPGWAAA